MRGTTDLQDGYERLVDAVHALRHLSRSHFAEVKLADRPLEVYKHLVDAGHPGKKLVRICQACIGNPLGGSGAGSFGDSVCHGLRPYLDTPGKRELNHGYAFKTGGGIMR
jgi:hypothetical protein